MRPDLRAKASFKTWLMLRAHCFKSIAMPSHSKRGFVPVAVSASVEQGPHRLTCVDRYVDLREYSTDFEVPWSGAQQRHTSMKQDVACTAPQAIC